MSNRLLSASPVDWNEPHRLLGWAADPDELAVTLELVKDLRDAARPAPRLRLVPDLDEESAPRTTETTSSITSCWDAFAALPASEARSRWQALFASEACG